MAGLSRVVAVVGSVGGSSAVGFGSPATVGFSGEGEIVLVDVVVMAVADQHEVVDVGGACGGRAPGDDVVGVAVGGAGTAEDAAAVAGDQCSPLLG